MNSKLVGLKHVALGIVERIHWFRTAELISMAASFALQEGEFVLSGGRLKKSMIGTGMTIVAGLKFVPLNKGQTWLVAFTSGVCPQRCPLTQSNAIATIHSLVIAEIQKKVDEIIDADGDGASADDEDLADQLDLETMGINHEKKEKNKLTKRNLQQLATTMKVQIDLPGASAGWAPTFVTESGKCCRIELTVENIDNVSRVIAEEMRVLVSADGSQKAKPKKKAKTSPMPHGSPSRRKLYFKQTESWKELKKGVKAKPGARTPRSYHVVSRKRPANHCNTHEIRGAVAAEPLEDVFGSDDIPDFDADEA